jgi:hypothetical protein
MKNRQYTTHDIHSRASVDGVISGTDVSEGQSQIELSERVYRSIVRFISAVMQEGSKSVDGFRLTRESVVKKQDAGAAEALGFVLTDGVRSLNFTLKRAGARGQFLNAWWNPNRFLSGGQNVFPAVIQCREDNRALDVYWKYLPHVLVEYPFALLVQFLDEICGKTWAGRETLKKALDKHEVFWQRLDFTVYSDELTNADFILGAMEVAAKTKNFTNLFGRERSEKCAEMSLQSLLKIGFEDDGGNTRGYSYVRLNKFVESKGKGRKPPTAFSISFYLKEKEAGDTGDRRNLTAIEQNPGVVTGRLRQEFTFYAASMMKVASIKRVLLGESTEGDDPLNIRKSEALLRLFPDEDTFKTKMHQLMVAAMKEMSLDWLLTPKNPRGVAEKDIWEDELTRDLLRWWEELSDVPLPSPRDTFNLKKFQATRQEISDAYRQVAVLFADLQVMSYAACQMLYFNMVRACLSKEDYLELQSIDTKTHLSSADLERRTALLKVAVNNFVELRRELRNTIGYRPLKTNLLGG